MKLILSHANEDLTLKEFYIYIIIAFKTPCISMVV